MLERITDLLETKENFAFEITLATKSYRPIISLARADGYNVTLLFFWLQNVNLAIEPVKTRVLEGGHNIETEVIKRRYKRGIKNLFEIYLPVADEVMIFDNSEGKHELIAEKTFDTDLYVLNEPMFEQLKKPTMKTHKRTPNQQRILEGMDKVYEKLIAFKIKMNSELVILKNGKIVRIKPVATQDN